MQSGAEIRAARRLRRLTQEQLAALVGTSQTTISAYESGRKQPSVATLERLLGACGARLEVVPAIRSDAELETSGARLAEVLALAESLPYRPRRDLRFPRLAA